MSNSTATINPEGGGGEALDTDCKQSLFTRDSVSDRVGYISILAAKLRVASCAHTSMSEKRDMYM